MQYFNDEKINENIFYKAPGIFTKYTNKDVLKYAIGANMYTPGTNTTICEKLIIGDKSINGLGAITFCLEDAIPETDVKKGEENIICILDRLYKESKIDKKLVERLPLIFVRVRSVSQFQNFINRLTKEELSVLTGFNFPKFNSKNGYTYFSILSIVSKDKDELLYGMPILEDKHVIYKETRVKELQNIQNIFEKFDKYLLNIRVGATDFSSLYGLRRNMYTTVYDLRVVSDCLTDILNFFLRSEKEYVVSGPVWEYFSNDINAVENQTFINELELDIQNGFQGKTIIHPSQIDIVNKKYIVNYNEYQDAYNILHNNEKGGVFKSKNGNQMNEVNPHRTWAKKILARAEIFGILM